MLFDTPISVTLIVAIGLFCLVLALWSLGQSPREAIPKRFRLAMMLLRLAVVLGITSLALNPYFTREIPDTEGFRVTILADVSGSMETADASGRTRLKVIQELMDEESSTSLRSRLARDFNIDVIPFVDKPLGSGSPLKLLPGTSAIGDTLDELLNHTRERDRTPGAVLLLSDGISLRGSPVVDAARRFRAAGVPVSTIGIGSNTPPGDISLNFQRPPRRSPAGEPLSLPVRVGNHYAQDRTLELVLYAGDRELTRTPVTVPAGSENEVVLETVPELPGFETYRVRLAEPLTDDSNPANDQAYAAIEITPPDTLEVLFLSNRVGNTFRFLQELARQGKAVNLRAIIRIGEDRFFVQGLENLDAAIEAFPTNPEIYLQNRVLIVDTHVLSELSEPILKTIEAFLLHRAGGVLFFGPPSDVPSQLRPILPVREAQLVQTSRQEILELAPDPVFREATGGVLFMPPGLFLPENVLTGIANNLARGARVVTSTRQGNLPLLAIQAYGAGRSAWFGSEDTWRWRMAGTRSGEQYALFWTSLLGWLGSGGKPRLETPIQATVQTTDVPVPLDVRILGKDFRPASDANVTATLSAPDGQPLPPITLVPGPYEIGHFTGTAILSTPGEYRVDYRVTLTDGEEINRRVFLVATRQGQEFEDIVFRSEPLQDLSRITNGKYVHYSDIESLLPLPLAPDLPTLEQRIHWTRTPIFLILILTIACLEWFLRRRAGLR